MRGRPRGTASSRSRRAASSRCRRSTGFGITSSAPARTASSRSLAASLLVSSTTGTPACCGFSLSRRHSAAPSRPGIETSAKTRSGRTTAASVNASSPLAAVKTRPARARNSAVSSRSSGVSSTTRMVRRPCASGTLAMARLRTSPRRARPGAARSSSGRARAARPDGSTPAARHRRRRAARCADRRST